MKELPWQCPEHPEAEILHSYDESQYVMNGYRVGSVDVHNHKYECNECGRELASERNTA